MQNLKSRLDRLSSSGRDFFVLIGSGCGGKYSVVANFV